MTSYSWLLFIQHLLFLSCVTSSLLCNQHSEVRNNQALKTAISIQLPYIKRILVVLGSWVALNLPCHTGKHTVVMPFSPLTLIFLLCNIQPWQCRKVAGSYLKCKSKVNLSCISQKLVSCIVREELSKGILLAEKESCNICCFLALCLC